MRYFFAPETGKELSTNNATRAWAAFNAHPGEAELWDMEAEEGERLLAIKEWDFDPIEDRLVLASEVQPDPREEQTVEILV